MEAGSPLDRIVLTVILFLGLLVLSKRKVDWAHALHENPWVTLLLAYMLISILWSEMPFSSFKRWTRELVALIMALVVSSEEKPLYSLQCLFTRTIYILIPFSLMLVKYYPHLGVQYGRWSGSLMWIGVASQKNGLAQICLFAFFFLCWTLIRRRRGSDIPAASYQTHVEVFLLLLTTWLFIGPNHTLAYSATSTITLSAGLMALVALLCRQKHCKYLPVGGIIVAISFIILYGTFTPFIGKLTIIDVTSMFGRDETLTERSSIWTFLIPYALRSLILGYGFGGFWTDEIREQTSSHAHNGYLDVILNIGIFGLLLTALFLLSSCRKAYKTLILGSECSIIWVCLLLMTVIHNIAESTIVSFTSNLMAFLLFFAVCSTATGATVLHQSKTEQHCTP